MRGPFRYNTGCSAVNEIYNLTIVPPQQVCCNLPRPPDGPVNRLTLYIPPVIIPDIPYCVCFTGIERIIIRKPFVATRGDPAPGEIKLKFGMGQWNDECCTKHLSVCISLKVPCMPVGLDMFMTNAFMRHGHRLPSRPPIVRFTKELDCSLRLTFDMQLPCIPFQFQATLRYPPVAEGKRPPPGWHWANATLIYGQVRRTETCAFSFALDIKVPCFPMWIRPFTGTPLRFNQLQVPRTRKIPVTRILRAVPSIVNLARPRWTHMYTIQAVNRTFGTPNELVDYPTKKFCTVFYKQFVQPSSAKTYWRYPVTVETLKQPWDLLTRVFQPIPRIDARQAQAKGAGWTAVRARTWRYSVLFDVIATHEPTCNVQFKLSIYAPCIPFCLYYRHRDIQCRTFNGPAGNVRTPGQKVYSAQKLFVTRRLAKLNPYVPVSGIPWHKPVFTFALTMGGSNTCALTCYFDFALPCFPITMVYNKRPVNRVVTFNNNFPELTVPKRTYYVKNDCTFMLSMMLGFPMGIAQGEYTFVRRISWRGGQLYYDFDIVYYRRGVAISHKVRAGRCVLFQAERC